MYSVSLWDPELFCNIACLNSREHEGNSSGSAKGESTGSTTTGSSTGWGIHPTYVSVAHLNSCREKEQVFCWAYCSTKWITLRFLHAHVSLVRKMIMFCWNISSLDFALTKRCFTTQKGKGHVPLIIYLSHVHIVWASMHNLHCNYLPTTIRVNSNPRLTALR